MTNTYYARNEYEYSGGDKTFTITFYYIKKDYVKVLVNGTLITNFTFNTSSQITINDKLEVGDKIVISRETPINNKLVTFTDTSILNKDTQNLSQDQLINGVQEIADDTFLFKEDINTTIATVEKAAEKVNKLEESVDSAHQAALEAAESAQISISQAEIATDKANETISALSTRANVDLSNLSEVGLNKFAGFGLFDTKLTDHILEGQDAVGWALQGSLITMTYPDAVAKIKELYENGTDTEYRGITCRRSTDGRYVADVSQKDAIDALFTESGVADFYVLDEVNNSFYLPRTKWFHQMTLDTSIVNNYIEAGLPNIIGKFISSDDNANLPPTGAFKFEGQDQGNATTGGSSFRETHISFNASRSSKYYGNSETVQPPSSNKLLYYKVGNTVINESLIDIGHVLAELQLKVNKDLSNTVPSQLFKNQVINFTALDYMNVVTIASSVDFTAPKSGILYIGFDAGETSTNLRITRNGVQSGIITSFGTYPADAAIYSLSLLKGDTVSGRGQSQSYFIPFMGGE